MTDELEVIDPDEPDPDEPDDDDDGAPAGFDFSQLLASAQQMQQQLLDAQAKAAEQVVEGQAGGGVVRIRVTGGFDFQQVTIDPSVVDPADVDMLQDLVLAALHEAVGKVGESGLAFMHVGDDVQFGAAGVGDFGIDQRLGDDSHHFSARRESRIGHRAHQAQPAAPIDNADSAPGQLRAKANGGLDIDGIGRGRRPAIDRKALEPAR